jgi:hypothetical protein
MKKLLSLSAILIIATSLLTFGVGTGTSTGTGTGSDAGVSIGPGIGAGFGPSLVAQADEQIDVKFISNGETDCELTGSNTKCEIGDTDISLNTGGYPSPVIMFNNFKYDGSIEVNSNITIQALGNSSVNNIKVGDDFSLVLEGNSFTIDNSGNIAGISGGKNITIDWGSLTINSTKAGIATSGDVTVQSGGNLFINSTKIGLQIDQDSDSKFDINNGGNIEIKSSDSIGVNVPTLTMESGGNLYVTGETFGVYVSGELTMDGGTKIQGTLTGDEGVAVLAKGISVVNGASLSGEATDSSKDAKTFGVVSGWKSDISVSGANSELVGSGNVGVTTIYPTNEDAGNIYVDGGTLTANGTTGDGVAGLNITVNNGGSIKGVSNSQHGIGAVNTINLNNSTAKADGGLYGIGANGDIVIHDSKVDASGTDEGICTDSSVTISGESTVTVTPSDTGTDTPTSSDTETTGTDTPSASDTGTSPTGPSDTGTTEPSASGTSDTGTSETGTVDPDNPTGSQTSSNPGDYIGIHTGDDVNIDITGSGEVVIITDPTSSDITLTNNSTDASPTPSETGTTGTSAPGDTGTSATGPSDTGTTEPSASGTSDTGTGATGPSASGTNTPTAITTGGTTGYFPEIPGLEVSVTGHLQNEIVPGKILVSDNNEINNGKVSEFQLNNQLRQTIVDENGVIISNVRISVKIVPSFLMIFIIIGIILILLLCCLLLWLILFKKKSTSTTDQSKEQAQNSGSSVNLQ